MICFYISKNNQTKEINSKNKKEKFQSGDTSATESNAYQKLPVYSISIVSTPYLTYLKSLNGDGKTYAISHIRFNSTNFYIPIKITPLCKYDVIQKKILFYFLIDTLGETEYNNYNGKIMEPTITFDTDKKYRNFPLLKADGTKVYRYKIKTETNYTEFVRIRTDLKFMLPHTTDLWIYLNDRDINKLRDIDMNVEKIDDSVKEQVFNDQNIGESNKESLIVPKLINSSQVSSLKSLGMSLFNFSIVPEDIEIIYKPSINYTETYQLSTDFYSYQKLNCTQISRS